MGGTSVNGVAADGLGHVYFVGASGVLYRYSVAAGTFTRADSGLLIEAGHTSTLGFDKDGNLWLGEQPVADLPNGGRVRVDRGAAWQGCRNSSRHGFPRRGKGGPLNRSGRREMRELQPDILAPG